MKRKILAKMIGDRISSNNFNLIEGKKLDREKNEKSFKRNRWS